jgi:hypothetical protein
LSVAEDEDQGAVVNESAARDKVGASVVLLLLLLLLRRLELVLLLVRRALLCWAVPGAFLEGSVGPLRAPLLPARPHGNEDVRFGSTTGVASSTAAVAVAEEAASCCRCCSSRRRAAE